MLAAARRALVLAAVLPALAAAAEPARGPAEAEAEAERRLLLEVLREASAGDMAPGGTAPGALARNIGQVRFMALPPGFVGGRRGTVGPVSSLFQSYHLAAQPEVQIYFEYRGFRIGDAGAAAFRHALAQAPHVLSAAELAPLAPVLRSKRLPPEFELERAQTASLAGKRVLIVEGRRNGFRARTVYVDADGSGAAVQEITFLAPARQFARHLPAAVQALESIAWR